MVADLQERAREASLQGDWERVEHIIIQGKKIAGDNEWLRNSLIELEVYAKRRQRDEFSKEAFYSSDKMNRRLSSHLEMSSKDTIYPMNLIKGLSAKENSPGQRMS